MEIAFRLFSILLVVAALAGPTLRWRRAAFGGFVALGLLYFPLHAGWPAAPLVPRSCEHLVSPALALHSFRNIPHIVLSASRLGSHERCTTCMAPFLDAPAAA